MHQVFTLVAPLLTPEVLPTGVPALDAQIGGLPRGCFTEVVGPPSSGRTSLLLSVLAQATQRQECCALVDTSNTFDPQVAQLAGVSLPHLLWTQCSGNAEHALQAADWIVHAGGFSVVVLDLADTDPAQARRISLASWFRLRQALEKTPSILLVIGQHHYAGSCSALQLRMQVGEADWTGTLLEGASFAIVWGKHLPFPSIPFAVLR